MSKMMKVKVLLSILIICTIIGLIIVITNISKYFESNLSSKSSLEINDDNLNKNISRKDGLTMTTNYAEIIYTVSRKNSDWKQLPLSKRFKNKYNSKDGILRENNDYTYLSYSDNLSNNEKKEVVLIVEHNLKQEYYYIHYTLNDNNELDDVEIVDKVLKQDEKGNLMIYKKTMVKKYYLHNLILVAFPARLEYNPFEYINVTDYYLTKWRDGFVNGAPIFSVEAIESLCDYNNRLVYLKCEYPEYDENDDIIGMNEEQDLYYRVHFYIDENMWLDDVEVEEVSKEKIDKLLKDKAEIELP